jgi:hypothetical protein
MVWAPIPISLEPRPPPLAPLGSPIPRVWGGSRGTVHPPRAAESDLGERLLCLYPLTSLDAAYVAVPPACIILTFSLLRDHQSAGGSGSRGTLGTSLDLHIPLYNVSDMISPKVNSQVEPASIRSASSSSRNSSSGERARCLMS